MAAKGLGSMNGKTTLAGLTLPEGVPTEFDQLNNKYQVLLAQIEDTKEKAGVFPCCSTEETRISGWVRYYRAKKTDLTFSLEYFYEG